MTAEQQGQQGQPPHRTEHYDLVIVGTGSGNSVLGPEYDDLRVAIIDNGRFGGTCLNRGCIPSKMFVLPATRAAEAADSEHLDLDTSFDGADWTALRDRVFARTEWHSDHGHDYREGQQSVDVWHGTARLTSPTALEVTLDGDHGVHRMAATPGADRPPSDAGEVVSITTDQLVLASGSRPIVPDIPGLDACDFHTSDDVMHLDHLPESIAVIGGGYVGCEFSHVFSGLGSRVVQIEAAPTLLAREDDDVHDLFTETARQRWNVRLDVSLDKAESLDGGVRLHLSDGSSLEVETVLVAIGRTTNADLLAVAEAGIEVDDAGRVVVDEYQRASVPGVWALGDASAHEPLKHVANQDARVVRHNLLHPDDLMVSDHRHVPHAVFTDPQVAGVGLTEREAREAGIDLAVARHDIADVAYGWARHADPDGFVKLLGDRATGRLVGAHMIGPEASSMIQPLIQAMSFDQPVKGLARGQYWIHPALAEVLENALIKLEEALADPAS